MEQARIGGMGGMMPATDKELEAKPTLCLSGEQLAYLKIDAIPVGAKLQFSAVATIKELSQEADDMGGVQKEVYLEMDNIQIVPEQQASEPVLYPVMAGQQ